MRKNSIAVTFCVLFTLLTGCGLKKNQQQAAVAIAEYHKRFNDNAADAIWDAAGDEFKKATPRDRWARMIQTLNTKLGSHGSSGEPTIFVNWTTKGTFVKATCESTYSKASATETFQFRKNGEKLILVGYTVNSSALLE